MMISPEEPCRYCAEPAKFWHAIPCRDHDPIVLPLRDCHEADYDHLQFPPAWNDSKDDKVLRERRRRLDVLADVIHKNNPHVVISEKARV